MTASDAILARIRTICLGLPDTKETPTWGAPHFRVGEKIFAGWDDGEEGPRLSFKLERAHAEAILDDPRFRRAPYVGHHGWVSMDVRRVRSWPELRQLLLESYRLIASRASLAKLDAAPASRERGTAPAALPKPARAPRRGAPRARLTGDGFRRMALALPEATEGAHAGHPDFRVRNRIFATLGPDEDWGMVKLTPAQQDALLSAEPAAFHPASGAWGRGGATIVRLAEAPRTVVRDALELAWRNVAPRTLSAADGAE